jgi:N-acetylglutamate synthase-like GNAT family acetyltransferase
MVSEIFNLSEKKIFSDTCAAWSYAQWGCMLPQEMRVTLEKTKNGYSARSQSNDLPQTWVMLSDGKCVGMVSLKDKELEDHQDIGPWVGSLYIHPSYRHRGFASELMSKVEEEARKISCSDLYLFSSDACDYYLNKQSGWQIIRNIADPIEPSKMVPIMRKSL